MPETKQISGIYKLLSAQSMNTLRMCLLTRQDFIADMYRRDPVSWKAAQDDLIRLADELGLQTALNHSGFPR